MACSKKTIYEKSVPVIAHLQNMLLSFIACYVFTHSNYISMRYAHLVYLFQTFAHLKYVSLSEVAALLGWNLSLWYHWFLGKISYSKSHTNSLTNCK